MGSERSMIKEINIVHTSKSWMYKISKKNIAYDLAEAWILFWSFYMIIATILFKFTNDTVLIYKGFFFVAFIFAMTLIRKKIKRIPYYIVLNLALLVIAFIVSFSIVEKISFGIPVMICFLYSIKLRRENKINFLSIESFVFLEIVIFLCFIVSTAIKMTLIQKLTYISAINVGISFIIYLNIYKTSQLMIWEGDFLKNYKTTMDKIKLKCAVFIGAVIAFILLIFSVSGFNRFMDKLTLFILNILSKSGNNIDNTVKPIPKTIEDNTPTPNMTEGIKSIKSVKPNHIVGLLLEVLQVVLIILVCIIFIRIVYLIIKKILEFYKSLKYHSVEKDEEKENIFSVNELKENLKDKTVGLRNMLRLGINLSNKNKIRKLYLKKIKEYDRKGGKIKKYFTPIEISKAIETNINKNIEAATLIYEKARYSKDDSSKEEFDKIKSLF